MAGINVERNWVLVMLIAGGLAGLSGAAVIQGTDFTPQLPELRNLRHRRHHGRAARARARPLGVVLAGLLFGALHAGAPLMQAATGTPVDMVQVLEAADRPVRRGAAADPGDVPAPPGPGHAGWERSRRGGTDDAPQRRRSRPCAAAVNVIRRLVAAAVFVLFGLIDILVFGFFAHQGDATFALSLPTSRSKVTVPNHRCPRRRCPTSCGGLSIADRRGPRGVDRPA